MIRPFEWMDTLLSRYSNWWADMVSEDWYDLGTLPGLCNGVVSMLVNAIQFTLLLFLALLSGITRSGGDSVTPFGVLVFLLSLLSGAGMFFLYQTNDRINQQMRTYPEQMILGLKMQLLVYGSYSLLLLYDPVVAIMAAMAYLLGKAGMLLVFFAHAQLKRAFDRTGTPD